MQPLNAQIRTRHAYQSDTRPLYRMVDSAFYAGAYIGFFFVLTA